LPFQHCFDASTIEVIRCNDRLTQESRQMLVPMGQAVDFF